MLTQLPWTQPAPSRVSAVRPTEEQAEKPVFVPPPGQALSFDEHIKPLFGDQDRRSMSFAFDLWSEADVTQHAIDILTRLRLGQCHAMAVGRRKSSIFSSVGSTKDSER